MFPPVFPLIAASAPVKALIGSSPVRFYQFGMAPQNVQRPYVVWQRSSGAPENYLGDRPGIDQLSIQIDCYATGEASGADQVRNIAAAVRDAIEGACYITSWLGESIDPDTKNHRFTFLADFWTPR